MKSAIIFTAAGVWLGLGIGLATKSWGVGLAMTVLFLVVAYKHWKRQRSQC